MNYSFFNDILIGIVMEILLVIDVNMCIYFGKVCFLNLKFLIWLGMFIKMFIKVNQWDDIIVILKEVIIFD